MICISNHTCFLNQKVLITISKIFLFVQFICAGHNDKDVNLLDIWLKYENRQWQLEKINIPFINTEEQMYVSCSSFCPVLELAQGWQPLSGINRSCLFCRLHLAIHLPCSDTIDSIRRKTHASKQHCSFYSSNLVMIIILDGKPDS